MFKLGKSDHVFGVRNKNVSATVPGKTITDKDKIERVINADEFRIVTHWSGLITSQRRPEQHHCPWTVKRGRPMRSRLTLYTNHGYRHHKTMMQDKIDRQVFH